MYRVVPGRRNWQIETAVGNLAGFCTVGLETRWQRFGQFFNKFIETVVWNLSGFFTVGLAAIWAVS